MATFDPIEYIMQGTFDGLAYRLPEGQLDRKDYMAVAAKLGLVGGKWKGGKVKAFLFASDARKAVEKLLAGPVVSEKKEFQFFATPADIAYRMAVLLNLQEGNTILEPSAGQGALVKAVRQVQHSLGITQEEIDVFEAMPTNLCFLEEMDGINVLGTDFTDPSATENHRWDRIIANPPFTKNQDIRHILRMMELLKPGGILVAISSEHWTFAQDRESNDFRTLWLDLMARGVASWEQLEAGTFKESGTGIRTRLLTYTKA